MAELVLRVVEPAHAAGLEIRLASSPAEVGDEGATIQLAGDAAMVEHRGAEDGVFVNEQPIHGPHVMLPGDRVRVGLRVYELCTPADEVSPAPAPPIPSFRVQETPPDYVAPGADQADSPDSPLLKAWRDTHVKRQTHIAAFAVLAVAGLAVGLWLGFH